MVRGTARLLATTLCSSEKYLLRAYIHLAPAKGDVILLIMPEDKCTARDPLLQFLSMITPRPDIEELELNPERFEENVITLVKMLSTKKREGMSLFVNPVGGPDLLDLALFYAATFVGCTLIIQTEDRIRTLRIKSVVPDISKEKLRFLKEFSSCSDPKIISSRLNINPSTAYRHVSGLEALGLLEKRRPTLLAKVLLELNGFE